MSNVSSGRPHIVLIEDNPSDVYLIKLALEQTGIDCDLTNLPNGTEALRRLVPAGGDAPAPARIDLILLDLNTPGCDGFEILARMRAERTLRNVPIAIVTSSASRADKQQAASMGAAGYLEKPTTLAEFLDKIGSGVKDLLSTGNRSAAR